MTRRRSGLNDREKGSGAIELVASIPLIVAITILVIQGLLAVSALNAVTGAARDGARAAAAGRSGQAAARAKVPDWVQVRDIQAGPGVGAGCQGVCSRVSVGVPVGLPGFLTLGYIPLTREADFAFAPPVG